MTDVLVRRGHAPVTVSSREPSSPDCGARLHRSDSAYHKHRCRCPEAVALHSTACKRKGTPKPRKDPAEVSRIRAATIRAWWAANPWLRWRGPHARVDTLTVDFLVAGYRFAGKPPTKREYQLAAWRMSANGLGRDDTAAWLGVDYRTVERYHGDRYRLRAERTARRLADAKWRAMVKHGQRG